MSANAPASWAVAASAAAASWPHARPLRAVPAASRAGGALMPAAVSGAGDAGFAAEVPAPAVFAAAAPSATGAVASPAAPAAPAAAESDPALPLLADWLPAD